MMTFVNMINSYKMHCGWRGSWDMFVGQLVYLCCNMIPCYNNKDASDIMSDKDGGGKI